MLVRRYNVDDEDMLRKIHADAGYDYEFPNLASSLFLNRVVATENGIVISAGMHRVCYETFLLVDPSRRPQVKWEAIKGVQNFLLTEAYLQGLDEIHASVPPIGFDRRLVQLGWTPDRPDWKLWSRRTYAE